MRRLQLDTISFLCCIAGMMAAAFFLILGIQSIGATGWGRLGIFFIPPSAATLLFILADLLALLRKKWVAWSWFSTISKCLCAGMLVKPLVRSLAMEIQSGISNFFFFLAIMVFLLISVVPSVWNIVRFARQKKDRNKNKNE